MSEAAASNHGGAASRVRLLWARLGPERRLYLLGAASAVVAGIVAYGVPLGVQSAIAGAFERRGTEMGEGTDEALSTSARMTMALLGGQEAVAREPWRVGLFVALSAALAGGLLWLKGWCVAHASQRAIRRLRQELHEHLHRLPAAFFRKHESGDLLQRCTSDVDTVLSFMAMQVIEIVRCSSLLLAAIPIMLFTDAWMTVASLLLVPPITWFGLVFFHRVRHRFLAKDEAEGALTARAQENLNGIRVVRAFDRGDFERARFRKANAIHRDLDRGLFRLFAIFWSASDLLCLLQLGIVIGLGLWRVSEGTLSVPDYAFFLIAVNLWLWPFRMMGRILADLGKATVSIDRLDMILREPEETSPTAPLAPPPEPLKGALRFDRVGFRHDAKSAPALDDVTFEIAPGETVALMGPSGSGKSTLIDLLLRLADPDRGTISLDGVDIGRLPRAWVRSRISSVLQQPFLFSRSIRENLVIAAPQADEHSIHAAAADAALQTTIERFEQGYDTIVGERGITLSGGQRQRLAIARALLRDAPVLILDDALSAVDNETEREIVGAIRARHGRRTTIVIAHRISTLTLADRVVVLERGRVVDIGRADELRQRPGLFRRLWEVHAEVEREAASGLAGGPAAHDRKGARP
ncbi:MAG: ABC transporter ATP-binding protein [Phycisphaeraceae bacterium]|nr:ABC transporter ATP-binding protein [Phycisphaeraceae bacterium]